MASITEKKIKEFFILLVIFACFNCQPLQFPPRYPVVYSQPLYQSMPDYGRYVGPPLANYGPAYNSDIKYPAFGLDAPGNYQRMGKYNHMDDFLTPAGMPRWYAQPLGGNFFKHNPIFDWNPQYVSGYYPAVPSIPGKKK